MLTLIPVSLAQANEFVRQHHRHHKPVAGHKFSIGCAENGRLCAVAIVGRPVSRYLDDGFTLEVNRLCSDGTKNACSILYAAAARAARAMGYRKIITYTLDTESGASLRAAGWTNAGLAGGKAWTGSRRPAQPLYPAQMKYRYEKRLNERSSHITEDGKKLFAPEKEAVGICPRCKSPVYEGKKNFYCSDRSCRFVMWKNDKFFESRRTVFSKKIAAALLKDGKAKVKGLYSERTGKTYDGTVLLCDTGEKYVNYRIEQRK